jgi:carboxypeptidase Taq
MSTPIESLREHLGQVIDLHAAMSVLHWDMETYMPPKGGEARGKQLSTLAALSHRMFTSDTTRDLLRRLGPEMKLAPENYSDDERKLVELAQYDFDRATKLPESLVQRLAEEESRAYQTWVKAREACDFKMFEPHLQTLVGLLRQKADYLGYEESPYDALLEEYEPGMTASQLRAIFGPLKEAQSDLVRRIAASGQQPEQPWLEQVWDQDAQWSMTLRVLRDMGYDLEAGRQDISVHPFTTNFDIQDVRVTTRVDTSDLFSALTGAIHEGGHALYEQGFRLEDRRSLLGSAVSLGIHESQSRMWENIIGRSLPFWEHYLPVLREHHPGKLDGVSAEDIHRALNRVEPSLIRVEADECTYNLHIVLRFEIEVALIEGTLAVKDVPEMWNQLVKQYLGLEVPDDAQGCLQDIHWSHGSMGYFPTYALGNLYAAELFEAILRDVPDLWAQVGQGNFSPLLGWLREHVHRHGRRLTAVALMEQATGKAPGSEAFMRYLTGKYSALYDLG